MFLFNGIPDEMTRSCFLSFFFLHCKDHGARELVALFVFLFLFLLFLYLSLLFLDGAGQPCLFSSQY